MKHFLVRRPSSSTPDPHAAAYAEYFNAAQPRLLKFAQRKTGRPALAEEFTQEALTSAWKKWDLLLLWSPERRDSYLMGVIKNQWKSWLTQQQRAAELGHLMSPLLPHDETTDELATRAVIRRLIEQLPADLGEIVYLDSEGYSNSEIAKRLGIPESTARDHRKKAINALRAAWESGDAGTSGRENRRDQR